MQKFFLESFSNEKKELINEIVSLKKQIERYELDSVRKDTNTEKMQENFDNTLISLKESESKTDLLKAEVRPNYLYKNFKLMPKCCLKNKVYAVMVLVNGICGPPAF